jgi:C1A family cysteine protease
LKSKNMELNQKTVAVALLAVLGVAAIYAVVNTGSTNFLRADPVAAAWKEWKKNNSRLYGSAEESKRLRVFRDNFNLIQAHNAKANETYTLGINQFSDLTNKEFAALYTGAVVPKGYNASNASNLFVPNNTLKANDAVDWRGQGRVRAIKNQGSCGSCWAFAAVSALEGLAKVKTGSLPDLAEQELVDCTRNLGNYGCSGGWSQNAFSYAASHGIGAQGSYPYTAKDGSCKQVAAAFKTKAYANIAPKNVNALKQAIAQNGPVVVYIEADKSSFQSYKSGVYNAADCFAGGQINHAVTAVGYTANAWIVRNSWGTGWGDQGYILISQDAAAGGNGICGILSNSNTFPTA